MSWGDYKHVLLQNTVIFKRGSGYTKYENQNKKVFVTTTKNIILLIFVLVLLSVLKWEVTNTTSLAFSHFFLDPNFPKVEKIRRHAEYILILATSEYQFLSIRPSLLAAASVLAAHSGLNCGLDPQLVEDFSKRIRQRESDLRFVINALEETIENQRRFNISANQKSLVHNNNSIENSLIVENNNIHVVQV